MTDSPHFSQPDHPARIFEARLDAIRTRARAFKIDYLVLSPGDDLVYLLGMPMHSHERLTALVVPSAPAEAPTLLLPRVEDTAAVRSAADLVGAEVVVWADGEDPLAGLVAQLKEGAAAAVSAAMPARHLLPLQDRLGRVVLPAAGVIDVVRAIKAPFERELLSEAARRIDAVHARMGEFLVAGRTENEVAQLLERAIVEEGLTHPEFVIVGSGPNGADPHHGSSGRIIESGDVVVVDIGGPVVEGYHSDCTRTYTMGEPTAEVVEAYSYLEEAQRRAREIIRPGIRMGEIDSAARDFLTAHGLGEAFIHRTGHGIGLGLHEPPSVVAGNETPVEEGMTFSVEPGIYFPGKWGARLEDIVEVTADGVRELNNGRRELRKL